MTAPHHLQPEAGGYPARPPLPDEANPDPAPTIGGDFPDRPDESIPQRDQDQPDLDAFAARLGTDTIADAEHRPVPTATNRAVGRAQRVGATVAHGAARAMSSLADRLRSLGERLSNDGA